MLRHAIRGLVIFLIFMAIVGGMVFYLERSHFLKAEGYYREKNFKLAIREYETAMHFYLPFSPYIEKSAERLWHMAEMFEAEDKLQWAHMAYSSIRSSFYASRSFFTPGKDWIERADERLIDLNIKMLLKEGSIRAGDIDAERARHRYSIKIDRAPRPFWSVLASLGFIGWAASTVFIILSGRRGLLRKQGRASLIYGIAAFVFFFSLWIVALLKA